MLEHYAGNLPLWLAPIQVNIIPVNNQVHLDYVTQIKQNLKSKGIRVAVDSSNEKMGYKIRNAQIKKIPYTIVIGDNEVSNHTLSGRKHGNKSAQTFEADAFIEKILTEKIS